MQKSIVYVFLVLLCLQICFASRNVDRVLKEIGHFKVPRMHADLQDGCPGFHHPNSHQDPFDFLKHSA